MHMKQQQKISVMFTRDIMHKMVCKFFCVNKNYKNKSNIFTYQLWTVTVRPTMQQWTVAILYRLGQVNL